MVGASNVVGAVKQQSSTIPCCAMPRYVHIVLQHASLPQTPSDACPSSHHALMLQMLPTPLRCFAKQCQQTPTAPESCKVQLAEPRVDIAILGQDKPTNQHFAVLASWPWLHRDVWSPGPRKLASSTRSPASSSSDHLNPGKVDTLALIRSPARKLPCGDGILGCIQKEIYSLHSLPLHRGSIENMSVVVQLHVNCLTQAQRTLGMQSS